MERPASPAQADGACLHFCSPSIRSYYKGRLPRPTQDNPQVVWTGHGRTDPEGPDRPVTAEVLDTAHALAVQWLVLLMLRASTPWQCRLFLSIRLWPRQDARDRADEGRRADLQVSEHNMMALSGISGVSDYCEEAVVSFGCVFR